MRQALDPLAARFLVVRIALVLRIACLAAAAGLVLGACGAGSSSNAGLSSNSGGGASSGVSIGAPAEKTTSSTSTRSSSSPPPKRSHTSTPAQECIQTEAASAMRRLVYQPKRRMVESRETTVVAVLGNGPIPANSFDSEPTIVVRVGTTCEVQAELTGNGFDISPTGWQQRSFIEGGQVGWTWEVTPSETGALTLALSVQSLFVEQGATFDSNVTDYKAAIAVTSAPVSAGKRTKDFFEDPLVLAVLSAVLATALAVLADRLRRQRRRRKGDQGREDEDGGEPGDDTVTADARDVT